MARIMDPEGREIEVLQRLVELGGKQVLDIGCGEGRTARRIARSAASVLGVDPDGERIAVARETETAECTFFQVDVLALDMPPASLDVVVFSRSL